MKHALTPISALEILDSRGNPALRVFVSLGNRTKAELDNNAVFKNPFAHILPGKEERDGE